MPKIKAIPDGMLMMQNLMQRDTPVLMDNVEHSIASVLSDLDMEVASSEGIRIELNNLRQKAQMKKCSWPGCAMLWGMRPMHFLVQISSY